MPSQMLDQDDHYNIRSGFYSHGRGGTSRGRGRGIYKGAYTSHNYESRQNDLPNAYPRSQNSSEPQDRYRNAPSSNDSGRRSYNPNNYFRPSAHSNNGVADRRYEGRNDGNYNRNDNSYSYHGMYNSRDGSRDSGSNSYETYTSTTNYQYQKYNNNYGQDPRFQTDGSQQRPHQSGGYRPYNLPPPTYRDPNPTSSSSSVMDLLDQLPGGSRYSGSRGGGNLGWNQNLRNNQGRR